MYPLIPRTVKDFRALSHPMGIYKILAKVLATQLQPLISVLVLEFEGASNSERHIQEIGFIASELLDLRLCVKCSSFFSELDFYKVFLFHKFVFLVRSLGKVRVSRLLDWLD